MKICPFYVCYTKTTRNCMSLTSAGHSLESSKPFHLEFMVLAFRRIGVSLCPKAGQCSSGDPWCGEFRVLEGDHSVSAPHGASRDLTSSSLCPSPQSGAKSFPFVFEVLLERSDASKIAEISFLQKLSVFDVLSWSLQKCHSHLAEGQPMARGSRFGEQTSKTGEGRWKNELIVNVHRSLEKQIPGLILH